MKLFPPLISFFFIFLITLSSSSSSINAQQLYVRQAFNDCNNRDNSTSVSGFTCNGLNRTCQAYLTFRSRPPYNSVSSISNLLGADPSELASLNSAAIDATFDPETVVLVPVNCSCSGQYYQSNTSYVLPNQITYFQIANETFEGLTTCQALEAQNPNNRANNLSAGARINVPLRCACPSRNQIDLGVNYLLSYLVARTQSVFAISSMFGVDLGRTLEANGLSFQDSTVYPLTTLLVPLQDPPSSPQTISPPPPPLAPPPPRPTVRTSNGGSNRTRIPIISGVIGGIVLILGIGALVFCVFFKRKKKEKKADDLPMSSERFEAIEKTIWKKKAEEDAKYFSRSVYGIAQSLKVYTIEELELATENFSPSCWIKGSVYRGRINGDFAAIKKMDGDVSKEINLLNKINHLNLIRISGVCFDAGHWYVVYEYAVNGPLSDWIYNKNGDHKCLNWAQRMRIALDVANGLNYLHSYTSPPYVHKDIKSSNVLLDGEHRAKIGNFALARSAEGEEGEFVLTRHIVGTKGYMAPEYLENGLVSPKLDVYAFGILMLEIVAGKEVSDLYEEVKGHLSEVLDGVLVEEDGKENLGDFVDPSLQGNYPAELVIFVARLINRCIKKDPSERPGMDEVVQSLSNVVNTSMNWELSSNL